MATVLSPLESLHAALQAPTWQERRHAADAIRIYRDPISVSPLLAALLVERRGSVRTGLVRALVCCGPAAVIPTLQAMVDPITRVVPETRDALINIVRRIGTAAQEPLRQALTEHPDGAVRAHAATLVALRLPFRRANPLLLQALAHDPDAAVRAAAATGLGAVAQIDNVYALRKAAQEDADPDVRATAAVALEHGIAKLQAAHLAHRVDPLSSAQIRGQRTADDVDEERHPYYQWGYR